MLVASLNLDLIWTDFWLKLLFAFGKFQIDTMRLVKVNVKYSYNYELDSLNFRYT